MSDTITQEMGYLTELPDPVSREEFFLAAAAGMDVGQLPEPITRREQYLARIAAGGGGAAGGEAAGTAAAAVSRHNASTEAHEDLRQELQALSQRISVEIDSALAQAKAGGEFDGEDGYTPVKGVDYFTAADKTAIANEVKAGLSADDVGPGTFPGTVMASNQAYSARCLRNTRLEAADTTPTVDGEIIWTYG